MVRYKIDTGVGSAGSPIFMQGRKEHEEGLYKEVLAT